MAATSCGPRHLVLQGARPDLSRSVRALQDKGTPLVTSRARTRVYDATAMASSLPPAHRAFARWMSISAALYGAGGLAFAVFPDQSHGLPDQALRLLPGLGSWEPLPAAAAAAAAAAVPFDPSGVPTVAGALPSSAETVDAPPAGWLPIALPGPRVHPLFPVYD